MIQGPTDFSPESESWLRPLSAQSAMPVGEDTRANTDVQAFMADRASDVSEPLQASAFGLDPTSAQVLFAGEADRGLVGRYIERRHMIYHLMQRECPMVVTAPAGRGKSALVDVVAAELLDQNFEVLVLDVEPGANYDDIANCIGRSIDPNNGYMEGRASPRPLVIMVDSIDRLATREERNALLRLAHEFAGTMERARWCLIGRGHDALSLFSPLALSLGRVEHVALGLLSDQEISRIVFRLTGHWGLGMTPGALRGIVFLSRGLPAVAVRLCEAVAQMLASEWRGDITLADVEMTLPHVAAGSQGGGALLNTGGDRSQAEAILLACARAPHDETGGFRVEDVQTELRRMPYADSVVQRMIQKLQSQLNQLKSAGPEGPLLELRGEDGRTRYAFSDDRVPVHLLMRAFAGGRQ